MYTFVNDLWSGFSGEQPQRDSPCPPFLGQIWIRKVEFWYSRKNQRIQGKVFLSRRRTNNILCPDVTVDLLNHTPRCNRGRQTLSPLPYPLYLMYSSWGRLVEFQLSESLLYASFCRLQASPSLLLVFTQLNMAQESQPGRIFCILSLQTLWTLQVTRI